MGVAVHVIVKVTKASTMGLMNVRIVTTILADTGTENGNDAESI